MISEAVWAAAKEGALVAGWAAMSEVVRVVVKEAATECQTDGPMPTVLTCDSQ